MYKPPGRFQTRARCHRLTCYSFSRQSAHRNHFLGNIFDQLAEHSPGPTLAFPAVFLVVRVHTSTITHPSCQKGIGRLRGVETCIGHACYAAPPSIDRSYSHGKASVRIRSHLKVRHSKLPLTSLQYQRSSFSWPKRNDGLLHPHLPHARRDAIASSSQITAAAVHAPSRLSFAIRPPSKENAPSNRHHKEVLSP